jgi:tetratricopeptide (TPR) repeat protein
MVAFVYVHILAQNRLGWLEYFNDTPIAVSGETDGPGDDARIEFGERHPAVEAQAKHGLTGGVKLSQAVEGVRARSTPGNVTKVIFVVGRATKAVSRTFKDDLERFRVGREDGLHADIVRIAGELNEDRQMLTRLYVAETELDSAGDYQRKLAMQLLGSVLEDPEQAIAAWDVLEADAHDLAAKKLARTRRDLVDLLRAAKIVVRPAPKDERFTRQLDMSRRLLREENAAAALAVVGMLEADLTAHDASVAAKEQRVDSSIRYKAAQHRAAGFLLLGRAQEALVAARVALDLEPTGLHALMNAAQASAQLGEFEAAGSFIERALAIDRQNPEVWGAKLQITVLSGGTPDHPPAGVEASDAYQLALAHIALDAMDFDQAAELTALLLSRGVRDGKVLYVRAHALAGLDVGDDSTEGREHRADAERLATEALDTVPESSPLRAKLLVLRAELRRQRGDEEGNKEDLDLAAQISDHNPEAVAQIAQAQVNAGRADYALQTLRIRVTEKYPMLLVIRAEALGASGNVADARLDLDAAMARVNEAPEPDRLRLRAAEVALELKDAALAERFLDAISSNEFPEMRETLRGRIAFERRDAEAMQRHFRDGAERNPRIKPQLFAELAQRLLRLGCTAEAVAVFDEVGVDRLPPPLRQHYAGALMEANDLVRAAKLVEAIGTSDAAPDWALSVAGEIAARQGDTIRATEILARIARRHPNDPAVLFELSRRHLAMQQPENAAAYLDRLIAASTSSSPKERMAVAHILKEAGRIDDAVRIALAAFRAAPQDPALHRGFGTLLATDAPPVMHAGFVTDETYVRLTADNDEREYLIYREPPIDPRGNELLLGDAEKMGLAGLRVGDTVEIAPTGFQQRRWTVAEILPAVVYVFRDVMAHFEERFPSEPFFVHMMKLPDEDSVKFLAPIISTLQARKDRANAIFKMYQENTLPLGFVAGMLDATIPDVMQALSLRTMEVGPLRVEWYDAEGQEESRSVARDAARVVLTRSALETLVELDLLQTVTKAYEWCVPRALTVALANELADAEKKLTEGQKTMMAGDAGLRFDEVEPGDPSLQARVNRIRCVTAWVTANATVELRPLETIEKPSSSDEEARSSIGHDSLDAVQLAAHFNIALLADDLGLRRMLPKGSPGRSFSTITLIGALAGRKVIAVERAHVLLLRLIERNYVAMVPTRELLVTAITAAGGVNASVERAFALLGGPILDVTSAARIGAETLRAVHLLPLQVADLARVTRIILLALSSRWPVTLAAYSLISAAAAEFNLLPQALKVVRMTAAAFVKPRM